MWKESFPRWQDASSKLYVYIYILYYGRLDLSYTYEHHCSSWRWQGTHGFCVAEWFHRSRRLDAEPFLTCRYNYGSRRPTSFYSGDEIDMSPPKGLVASCESIRNQLNCNGQSAVDGMVSNLFNLLVCICIHHPFAGLIALLLGYTMNKEWERERERPISCSLMSSGLSTTGCAGNKSPSVAATLIHPSVWKARTCKYIFREWERIVLCASPFVLARTRRGVSTRISGSSCLHERQMLRLASFFLSFFFPFDSILYIKTRFRPTAVERDSYITVLYVNIKSSIGNFE